MRPATTTRSVANETRLLSASLTLIAALTQSGTLRVRKDDFELYNVNVQNLYGRRQSQSQALALSASGERQSFYACQFVG